MPEVEEQKFAVAITRFVDRKTKQIRVEMKTMGEGMPLGEAVIILEGWIEKVKKELQKPFNFDNMRITTIPKDKKDDKNGGR
ncbi:MAG: hypothetical protein V1944_01540 [Candidatus Aenigmatarchaeota archaeon]